MQGRVGWAAWGMRSDGPTSHGLCHAKRWHRTSGQYGVEAMLPDCQAERDSALAFGKGLGLVAPVGVAVGWPVLRIAKGPGPCVVVTNRSEDRCCRHRLQRVGCNPLLGCRRIGRLRGPAGPAVDPFGAAIRSCRERQTFDPSEVDLARAELGDGLHPSNLRWDAQGVGPGLQECLAQGLRIDLPGGQ